jgi:cobalt-zinc-cadmium efflux system outer membrane protein
MLLKKIAHLLLITLLASFTNVYAEPNLEHLSLEEAQRLFHENNKELLAAKRVVQGTEADAISAAQRPNPTLSLGLSSINLNRSEGNVNYNPNNVTSNSSGSSNKLLDQTINSSVQISQLYERGDKRELRMASARNAIKASNYDLKDAERQLLLSLNSAYYDLLLAQETEKILASNTNSYEKTIQAAELRLKVGDIAASDVARMRVDLLKIQNDMRQAKANREKAQTSLAYMMGQENEAVRLYAQGNWPALNQALNTAQNNVDARPDVLAAEARTKQAEENQRLANALKTRDINVSLQYQHYPGQWPNAGDNTIGAAISIPLFTNYEYQGEIARAEVDLTSAIEAKQQAHASAVGEIARAQADLSSAFDKVNRFDTQILTEAQKAADAAEFAYSHGATGITDLLDARRVLRSIQLDAANAHADYAKALAAWQAAIQTADIQN